MNIVSATAQALLPTDNRPVRGASAIGAILLAVLVGITGLGQLSAGGAPVLPSAGPAAGDLTPAGTAAGGTDPATGLPSPGVPGTAPGGMPTPGSPGAGGHGGLGAGATGGATTGPYATAGAGVDGGGPGGAGGSAPGPAVGPPQDGTVAAGTPAQIACWGDSLTYGSGGAGVSYPGVLAGLTGGPIYNGGVPGERSAGIAARQGGVPPVAAVAGGAVPASGPVEVTFGPGLVIADEYYTLDGTIAAVHGTLRGTGGGSYVFTRTAPGAPTPVPPGGTFVTDVGLAYRSAGTIIWAGHDDVIVGYPQQVLASIAAMAGFVQAPGRVLVLSLLNGTGGERGTPYYDVAVQTINPALAVAYGPDYLDIRGWLISDGLAAAGLTATAQDRADIAADIPPSSLRDPTAAGHLNALGYTVVARHIQDVIAARGWLG